MNEELRKLALEKLKLLKMREKELFLCKMK